MCAYNKLNGTFCSQNKRLLTEILRDEWGFEGFVVSDWGAVDERVMGLEAGLELEMPSSKGLTDKEIVEAVKKGEIDESVLDTAVERLLNIIFKAVANKRENATVDLNVHHVEARKIASECMVLLKNDNILPLSKDVSLAVIGAFAKMPRYQGGGSSHINPSKMDIPYDEIVRLSENKANVLYAEGFDLNSDDIVQSKIDEAKEIASKSKAAIIFAGLPDRYESEGYDRKHIGIPANQMRLIEEVVSVQPNTVIVLSNGSPVEMPWLGNVKAVLEAYLGGQAMGGAVADILFGVVNPSGKLAETFPVKLEHNPSFLNYPGEGDRVEYKEGVFVGYRYYDAKQIEPLFPFGYGLSYTTFEYEDLVLDKKEIFDTDILSVSVKVKNTGDRAGSEVVQLYVGDVDSGVVRPIKELKGFEKIELQPGEQKTVTFKLNKRSFAYYDTQISDWHVETGDFVISAGRSSKEILLSERVRITSTTIIPKTYTYHSTMGDLAKNPIGAEIVRQMSEEFERRMTASGQKPPEGIQNMLIAIMKELPLKKLYMFSGGTMTKEKLDEILAKVNVR
jgi:beta-glucosidase